MTARIDGAAKKTNVNSVNIPMELIIPKPNHCILLIVSLQSILEVDGSLQLCFRSQTAINNRRGEQSGSSVLLKGRFRMTSAGHEEAKTKNPMDGVNKSERLNCNEGDAVVIVLETYWIDKSIVTTDIRARNSRGITKISYPLRNVTFLSHE